MGGTGGMRAEQVFCDQAIKCYWNSGYKVILVSGSSDASRPGHPHRPQVVFDGGPGPLWWEAMSTMTWAPRTGQWVLSCAQRANLHNSNQPAEPAKLPYQTHMQTPQGRPPYRDK